MSLRGALPWFTAAVVALAGVALLARADPALLPSCLAAWLLLLALPLGALTVMLGRELAGVPGDPVLPLLRSMVRLMPVAALVAVPLLACLPALFPLAPAEGWRSTSAVAVRTAVLLVAWTGLALLAARVSRRPSAPGALLPAAGLALHLAMATVLACDWIGGLAPGADAASLGLATVLGQAGLAFAAACLVAWWGGNRLGPGDGAILAGLAAAWLFVHFTQYLVAWSANLPAEAGQALARQALIGAALAVLGVVAALIAVGAGLARAGGGLVAAAAALLVVVHAGEWFWLTVPAARGRLTFDLAGVLGIAAIAAVLAGLAALRPRLERGRHGRA